MLSRSSFRPGRRFGSSRLVFITIFAMASVPALTASSGCFHAQTPVEKAASANGKIGPKMVMPMYASTHAELLKRRKRSVTDGDGFRFYPFLLTDDKGAEVGIMQLVFRIDSTTSASHPQGAEVEFRHPAVSKEAALRAVGMNPERGKWVMSEQSEYPKFVYGKTLPNDPTSDKRIILHKSLSWLVVGTTR